MFYINHIRVLVFNWRNSYEIVYWDNISQIKIDLSVCVYLSSAIIYIHNRKDVNIFHDIFS